MTNRTTPLLPYKVSICGLEDLPRFADRQVSHVISILDPGWPEPTALTAYPPHWRITLRFDDAVHPCAGVTLPQSPHVEYLLALSEELHRQEVRHLLVHCHGGLSRSAAAVVILMAPRNPGREGEIFAALTALCPARWPNRLMIELADAILDRCGALVAALDTHDDPITRSSAAFRLCAGPTWHDRDRGVSAARD